MKVVRLLARNGAYTDERLNLTVELSNFSTLSSIDQSKTTSVTRAGLLSMATVARTSSAVIGWPSLHLAF